MGLRGFWPNEVGHEDIRNVTKQRNHCCRREIMVHFRQEANSCTVLRENDAI